MQSIDNITIGGNGLSGAIGQSQLQTEGMDFLDFLLGLQGKPEQALLDELLNPGVTGATVAPGDASKDVLLDLFQVKQEDPSAQLQGALLATGWSVEGMNQELPQGSEGILPTQPQGKEISLAELDVQIRSPQIQVDNPRPAESENLNSAGLTIENVEVFSGESALDELPENQANRLSLERNIREVQNQTKEKSVGENGRSIESTKRADTPIHATNEQEEVLDNEMIQTEDSLNQSKMVAENEVSDSPQSDVSESHWAPTFKAPDSNGGIQTELTVKGEESVEIKSSVSELTTKIDHMARQGGGKMTVSLNPPELGSVEIDVMSKGNQVEVKMRSDNDFAKSALEKHFGDLKISLSSHELVLSKAEVVVSKEPVPTGNGFADLPNSSSEQRAFNFQQQGSDRGNHERGQSNPFVERRLARNIETAFAPRTVRNHGDGLDLRI